MELEKKILIPTKKFIMNMHIESRDKTFEKLDLYVGRVVDEIRKYMIDKKYDIEHCKGIFGLFSQYSIYEHQFNW